MKDIITITIGIIIIIILLLILPKTTAQKEEPIRQTATEVYYKKLPLTRDNVLREICKRDIKFPIIVLKQSLAETMHYQCTNCSLDYNNLFGFRHKRYITHNNPLGYLQFDNWEASITYYKHWQNKYLKLGETDYYEFLKRIGYAEAKGYVDLLKKIKIE